MPRKRRADSRSARWADPVGEARASSPLTKIHSPWDIPGTEIGMMPLYLAQIEDLRQGEFVKVDCAACHHVALLTPAAFVEAQVEPCGQGPDLAGGPMPWLRGYEDRKSSRSIDITS